MENKEIGKNTDRRFSIYYLLRVSKDKTATQLAKELLVSPTHIHGIERGKVLPSIRLLRDYAKEFGVTSDFIIDFQPEDTFEKSLSKVLNEILSKEQMEKEIENE